MNQQSLFLYQTQKVGYLLAGLFCMFSIYALDVRYELLYSMSSLYRESLRITFQLLC